MSWNSFKELADQKSQKHKVWQQASESLVLTEANNLLPSVFGVQIDHLAQAVYLKKKVLTIAVLSDDVLAQVERKKIDFINLINQKFAGEVVKDLYFLR